MTFAYHPVQRIPVWGRGFALFAGKEPAPRFVRTVVERIALWTNLKDYDVDAVLLEHVKLMCEVGLHLLCAHAEELTVDTLNPGTTELAFRTCECSNLSVVVLWRLCVCVKT